MKLNDVLNSIKKNLGIENLNQMQKSIVESYNTSASDIILISPTGTGKTLAFALAIVSNIKDNSSKTNALVIAPSRELVIQLGQVLRNMNADLKITECYGGHKMIDETNSLRAGTNIIIATPGRMLDHLNRGDIEISNCKQLVLDEFDKTLELGFESEMKRIIKQISPKARIILTSATAMSQFPDFVKLKSPIIHDYVNSETTSADSVEIKEVISDSSDKLETLKLLLCNINTNGKIIVFVNYRESALRVYEFLKSQGFPVGIYEGSLSQIEREKAIELFTNGTFKILVSTDLASRGLDIRQVEYIIHYHLPISREIYIHRNGRTARQGAGGMVYIIRSPKETLPDYIQPSETESISPACKINIKADTETLHINAGKKEKISKGDILGFLVANSNLTAQEIGIINCHDHYSLVAIPVRTAREAIKACDGKKIKGLKVKISRAVQLL